jgi:hypothetical protein
MRLRLGSSDVQALKVHLTVLKAMARCLRIDFRYLFDAPLRSDVTRLPLLALEW